MRVPRRVDRALDAGLRADPRAVRRPGRVPAGGRPGGRRGGPPRAGPRPRRPHRPAVRHARPGALDRPRPGLRHRAGRATTSCCTTPSPTSASSCDRGDALDEEAWRRGVTVYMPDERARLYPAALSEGAASLLPTGPARRSCSPCASTPDGDVRLDGAERALVRSRAKLAYDTVRPDDLPAGSPSSPGASSAAEDRRGAPRVEFPEQELERVDGRWELRFDPRLASEDQQRRHVAGHEPRRRRRAARRRHRAVPGDGRAGRAGGRAAAPHGPGVRAGLAGRASRSPTSSARCRRDDPRAAAFLLAVRRAGGGASYEPYARRRARRGTRRWPPPTPTPPRRCAGSPTATSSRRRSPSPTAARCPTTSQAAFADLPEAMATRRVAGQPRRRRRSSTSPRRCCSPAARARCSTPSSSTRTAAARSSSSPTRPCWPASRAHRVDPGDDVRVRLDGVDVAARTGARSNASAEPAVPSSAGSSAIEVRRVEAEDRRRRWERT